MNKPAATENTEHKAKGTKEKITLEGWLFYLLLFMAIIGMPAASTIWILSAANGSYTP